MSNDNFLISYRDFLKEFYFTGFTSEYLDSDTFRHDVDEHTHLRTERFSAHLVPWVSEVFDLGGSSLVEVGSGTGSSTAAFAPACKAITCFEIDEKSTRVAKKRGELLGWNNVTFEAEPFGKRCSVAQSGRKFDVVLFIASLEHMHFDELEDTLGTAFEILRPGGIIVIAETPNRLSPFDYHSSWTPFFQWLPHEIRKRYYDRSPREHYVNDIGATVRGNPHELVDRFQRWGNGVSFHEFELVLGSNVHNWIIADGWEESVRPLAPVFNDDEVLLSIWDKGKIPANKAFARSWLYLIIRKP